MNKTDNDIRDRAIGAFMGMAIGDAMGAPAEFQRRGSFPVITGFRDGGPFNLKAGQWTDDTIMGVHLAKSLLKTDGAVNPDDIMPRWISWLTDGVESPKGTCFDIGNATRRSLTDWPRHHGFARDKTAEGNGGIMRIAPVLTCWTHDLETAVFNGIVQSRLTHGSVAATESAAYLTVLMWHLIQGKAWKEAIQAAEDHGYTHPKMQALVQTRWPLKAYKDVGSSGHCVDTLETALWCVDETDTPEAAILLAANMGDDSDTNAAVTGMIAGARYGWSSVAHMAQGLWRAGELLDIARRLSHDA